MGNIYLRITSEPSTQMDVETHSWVGSSLLQVPFKFCVVNKHFMESWNGLG